jgi:hypothetical protein
VVYGGLVKVYWQAVGMLEVTGVVLAREVWIRDEAK